MFKGSIELTITLNELDAIAHVAWLHGMTALLRREMDDRVQRIRLLDRGDL
jgi:hypothetical protein